MSGCSGMKNSCLVLCAHHCTAKSLTLFNCLPPYGRRLQLPGCCFYFLNPWIYFPSSVSLLFLPGAWTFWGCDKNQPAQPSFQLTNMVTTAKACFQVSCSGQKNSRWQLVRADLWFSVVNPPPLTLFTRFCRYPDSSVLCSDPCPYLRFFLFLSGFFFKKCEQELGGVVRREFLPMCPGYHPKLQYSTSPAFFFLFFFVSPRKCWEIVTRTVQS